MKKNLLIIFSLTLSHLFLYGQNTDTVQPDSLYRKYKIHSRSSYYEGSVSKSKEIFVFDKEGRYTGFILTDNETGNKLQMKMIYQFNDKGILLAENDTSFSSGHEIKKAEMLYAVTGELIKKTIKSQAGISSEIIYSPLEMKQTENLYRRGSIYRTQTTYYDKHHKKVRFTGTELADQNVQPKVFEVNGKQYTINPQMKDEKWDYIYNNTYDDKGNLVKQQRIADGKIQDETTFFYDATGLLKEQNESKISQHIKFEYTYY